MTQDALTDLLQLSSPVIAITFTDTPPAGIKRVASSGPASCAYWRQAADGETFYTVPDDHKACPIGAHTHQVETSAEEQQQLMGLIQSMVGLSYIKMEEVPSIPRRATPLRAAVYAPLASAPLPPDVLLVRGNARQLMLVTEAAKLAGVAGDGPSMGRPTCAVLPAAINSQQVVVSFGCVGNRVYTGATENEAYVAIPGMYLDAMVDSLRTILKANDALEAFIANESSDSYTLFFDNSMLADVPVRDRDIVSKTATFNRALQNMKILAEGATLPSPPARGAQPPARGANPG